MTANATNIYLKPGSNWSSSNAIFKLYVFNDETNSWADFNPVEDHDGYYYATIPAGTWSQMIIVRMNPGDTDKTYWDRKWTQTVDMNIPTCNTIYYVADDASTSSNDKYSCDNYEALEYKLLYGNAKAATGNAQDMVSMQESDFKFSCTFDNQTSPNTYWFMIVSTTYCSNNEPSNWNKVLFPNDNGGEDSPLLLTFSNNQEGTLANSTWTRWKIDKVSAKFTFTFDRLAATWSIEPYFTRTLPTAAEGYATFSSEYDVAVPEGLTAKYATDVTAGKITWEEFGTNGIKAGQGALLEGTAGDPYKFTPATSAEAPSVNFMKAINEKIQLTQTEDGNTNYILSKSTVKGEAALGFYKVNVEGSWCAAGTAYLSVPSQQAPEFIVLGETTGIANVNRENVSDNQYYMLDGRRVAQPTKGLYIVNGKKVIIK